MTTTPEYLTHSPSSISQSDLVYAPWHLSQSERVLCCKNSSRFSCVSTTRRPKGSVRAAPSAPRSSRFDGREGFVRNSRQLPIKESQPRDGFTHVFFPILSRTPKTTFVMGNHAQRKGHLGMIFGDTHCCPMNAPSECPQTMKTLFLAESSSRGPTQPLRSRNASPPIT